MVNFSCEQSKVRWKSTEELCLITLKSDPKFGEKLSLGSRNDLRNLVSFNASIGKSEIFYFDVLLLSIAYKAPAKKVQNNYLSWYWRVIQTLKKNRHFAWKMTWGIWWIWREQWKVWTLTSYFCRKYVMFELKNTEE